MENFLLQKYLRSQIAEVQWSCHKMEYVLLQDLRLMLVNHLSTRKGVLLILTADKVRQLKE